jgi:hypothetical protein
MPECRDQDEQNLIRHLVDESVVTDSDAVEVLDTCELLATGGTRIDRERIQAATDS